MCRLRDCSVCECPETEFPEPFKKPFHGLSSDNLICQEGKPEAAVDRTLDNKVFRGWVEIDNPWTYDDETDNGEAVSFTGEYYRSLKLISPFAAPCILIEIMLYVGATMNETDP